MIFVAQTSGAWFWARWLLLILLVLVFVFGIFFVNIRRRKSGRDPIRGTAWLAPPPTYGQSQTHYNRYNGEPDDVPQYTTHVNENDLGYYDREGKFHPSNPGDSGIQPPHPAMTQSSSSDERQAAPPPSHQLQPRVVDEHDEVEFERPRLPPPIH